MAVIQDSDLFDFDGYARALQQLVGNTDAFAKATETSAKRITAAYSEVQGKLREIATALQSGTKSGTLQQTGAEIDQLSAQATRYRAQLKTVDDAQRANQQLIGELTAKLKSLQGQYQALDPTVAGYARQQRAVLSEVRTVTSAITAQNKVLTTSKAAVDAVEGSYNHLNKTLNEDRAALKALDNAFESNTGKINKNNQAAVALDQRIRQNDAALKKMDAGMGQSGRNVGNYQSALSGLASGGIGGAVAGLGALGVAFAKVAQLGAEAIATMSVYEQLRGSLKGVTEGSDDLAMTQEFLEATANRLGVSYAVLVESYKGVKVGTKDTALEGREADRIFSAFANRLAEVKAPAEKSQRALEALSQMISKGNVAAEELRGQLGDAMPGAFKLFADAAGVSTQQLNDMLKNGEVLAVDILPKVADQLEKTFTGAATENVDSLAGATTRLDNQTGLLLDTFNQTFGITKFFATIKNGIADAFTGVRELVRSKEWGSLFMVAMNPFTAFLPNGAVSQAKERADKRDEFASFTPGQRTARIDLLKEQIQKDQLAGKISKVKENQALLNEYIIQQAKYDKADAEDRAKQAERQKKKAADDARAKRVAENRELSRKERIADINFLKKTIADQERNIAALEPIGGKQNAAIIAKARADLADRRQLVADLEKLNVEMEKKDAKKDAADAKRAKSSAKKQERADSAAKRKAEAETEKRYRSELDKVGDEKKTAMQGLDTEKALGSVSEADYLERKYQLRLTYAGKELEIIGKYGKQESSETRAMQSEITDAYNDYLNGKLKLTQDDWKKQLDETKKAVGEIDRVVEANLQKRLTALETAYNNEEARIKQAVAGRKLSEEDGERAITAAKVSYLSQVIIATQGAYDTLEQLESQTTDKRIADIERWKAVAERTPAEIESANEAIRKLKEDRDKQAADNEIKLTKNVADKTVEINKSSQEQQTKDKVKAEAERQALTQKTFEFASTVEDTAYTIFKNKSDAKLSSLQSQKEHELSLVGDNADAKAKIEADFAKRESEIRRKQAIAERTHALFSIAINTAQAVMSVLSTGGGAHYLDFGTSAGILSAFVTATGLAQAAAVLAAPLPAYWMGTSSAGEGPAQLAERGAELRQSATGKLTYYEKPTVDYLSAGDRIYTADQTARYIADWQRKRAAGEAVSDIAHIGQAANSLRAGRLSEQRIIIQSAQANLSESGIGRAVGQEVSKALDNRPVRESWIDADGFHEATRTGKNRTEYLNRRNSLPR